MKDNVFSSIPDTTMELVLKNEEIVSLRNIWLHFVDMKCMLVFG